MDNIYFIQKNFKKQKNCLLNNCNGKLISTMIKTKRILTKNNTRIDSPKDIHFPVKQCDKCGCYYAGINHYPAFKRYECANNFNVLNSNEQIIEKQDTLCTQSGEKTDHMEKEKMVETVKNIIIKDVFTEINTEKCVIDIFLQNQSEFKKEVNNIDPISLKFLNRCKQQLKEESDKGKILFFRKYNYEKILNDYLSKTYSVGALKISLLLSNKEKKDISEKEISVKEKQYPYLKENANTNSEIKQQTMITESKTDSVSDIVPQKTEEQIIQERLILQEQKLLSNISNITWTKLIGANYVIYEGIFCKKKVEFRINNTMKRKNPQAAYIFKYNNKPFHYIKYDGNSIEEMIEETHPKIDVINREKVIVVVNENITSKKKTVKSQSTKENAQKKKEEIAKRNAELEKQRQLKEERRRLHEERMRVQQEAKRLKELERKKNLELKEKEQQEMLRQLPQIGIKDFVVRRAVFKCMHSKHEVIDLAAAVRIIDDNGKEKLVKVSAGYCKVCRIYFIMESTYEKLRNLGVVLCRICDEKSYMKNSFVNGMKLAQESILMQFGYTVSQTDGLSATKRQKILAVIIDNHILSKSEIISYLDFFISQRQYQSKFEIAVSKWETDREFVQEYKIGEYTQFGVNAIYRR